MKNLKDFFVVVAAIALIFLAVMSWHFTEVAKTPFWWHFWEVTGLGSILAVVGVWVWLWMNEKKK